MPFCGLISASVKRVAICSSLTSSVEQECCSCFTWKAWSQRLLFVRFVRLWSHWSVEQGFYINEIVIIIFVVSQSWRFYHCIYSHSRKTVNTRENFWNVYCFATNQKRDETAEDNRQTVTWISHDFTRSNELGFSSTTNLQFYGFQILKLFFLYFSLCMCKE